MHGDIARPIARPIVVDWTRVTAICLGVVTFLLYSAFATRGLSWINSGGDSGDWLTAAMRWWIPHPVGSPLYVLYARFLWGIHGVLAPSTDYPWFQAAMGSSLPVAVTVYVVHRTVWRLTQHAGAALAASLVLAGMGVVWSQGTIVEEYTFAMMFIAIGLYFWLGKRLLWAWFTFGLSMAVHSMAILPAATCLYLSCRWGELHIPYRKTPPGWPRLGAMMGSFWYFLSRHAALFLPGLALYLYIPILMAMSNVPRLLAGPLTPTNLRDYLFGLGSYIGGIAPWVLPQRLFTDGSLIVYSLGFAIVPLALSWKMWPGHREKVGLALVIGSVLALVITELDLDTFTYLNMAAPAAAVAVGLALSRMRAFPIKATVFSGVALIAANAVLLNPMSIPDNVDAEKYLTELDQLPKGAVVDVNAGHWSLAVFYWNTLHPDKELVPLVAPFYDRYPWFREYMITEYGLPLYDDHRQLYEDIRNTRPVFMAGNETTLDRAYRNELVRMADWKFVRWREADKPWQKEKQQ